MLSCASPQKHFSKGNYEKAYSSALKELQKKNDRKLKQILNKSFNEIYKDKSYRIDNLSTRRELKDWEKAFDLYQELITDYDDGRRFLDSKYDTIIDGLIDDNELLALRITDAYEDLAYASLDDYHRHFDKFKAQDANNYFNKIAYYQPEYPAIDSLIDFSFYAGVINILIDVNIWDHKYQWDVDEKFSQLKNKSRGFLQVFYNTIIPNPDCEVDLNFDNLRIIKSESQTNRETFSKQIQDGYETRTDTSGHTTQVPKYKQIEGYVTTLVTTVDYNWRVNLMVDRYTNYCKLNTNVFNSNKKITRNSYDLNGDLRAIPEHYKTDTGIENFDADEKQVIRDLIRDLYQKVSSHLNLR